MIVEYGSVFITLAVVLGLFMTWGIGANDVANAMGTSVGSGAISVKQAIIIAAFFEFSGVFCYYILYIVVIGYYATIE